jgi:hypothetical protein
LVFTFLYFKVCHEVTKFVVCSFCLACVKVEFLLVFLLFGGWYQFYLDVVVKDFDLGLSICLVGKVK